MRCHEARQAAGHCAAELWSQLRAQQVWLPCRCPCRGPGGWGGSSVAVLQAHPSSPQHTFCRRCALKSGKALADPGPATSLPRVGVGGVPPGGPIPRPALIVPLLHGGSSLILPPVALPQAAAAPGARWPASEPDGQSSETHSSRAPGSLTGAAHLTISALAPCPRPGSSPRCVSSSLHPVPDS